LKLSYLFLLAGVLIFLSPHSYGSGKLPFFYELFQKKEFDLDSKLEQGSLQLQAKTCHYKSFVTKKELDFQGVGACLYESLIDGRSTDKIPGVITAQMKLLRTNEDVTLIIVWRPPKGGFFHLAKKVYRFLENKPFPGESDTVLGTIVVDFSRTEPQVIKNILSPLSYYIGDMSQLRLTAHPRLGHENVNDSLIEFYPKSDNPLMSLYWDWNFSKTSKGKNLNFSAGTLP
jgi:hypothetical protein